jgi:transaldolase
MKATQLLNNLGQSLWLDNITRDLLTSGTLKRYIDELSVTGLTSNPTIFENAVKNSTAYDAAIREKLKEGKSEEELFFDLSLEDLSQVSTAAADPGVSTALRSVARLVSMPVGTASLRNLVRKAG